ncbi:telomerase reverse transcriptase isoform X1 [Hydra vulgaris]|nr:telomerase reverse transcriptase-like [Hydra vulgaris]
MKMKILNCYFCKVFLLKDYFIMNNIFLSDLKGLELIKIGFPHDAVLFPHSYSKAALQPLEEVIHQAIKSLVRVQSNNLLSIGYKWISERAKENVIIDSQLVQTSFNSLVVYFKSKLWEQLHNAVGDEIILFLLKKCYLFLTVQHSCYIQLCGIPLYELDLRKCKCVHTKSVPNPVIRHQLIQANVADKNIRKRKMTFASSDFKRKKLEKTEFCEPLIFNKKVSKKACGWLQRNKMFYSKVLINRIHKNFIMNRVQPSNSGVYTLMQAVFHFKDSGRIKRLPTRLIFFRTFFKKIILNFKLINMKKLLACYCPLPKWFKDIEKNEVLKGKFRYKLAVQSFVPEQKVFLLLRKIVEMLIPNNFWGALHNKKYFFKSLLKFLRMGRYERCTVDYVMKNIKISLFNWTSSTNHKQQCSKRFNVIRSMFLWLYNDFLIPIVRAFFYVTETSSQKFCIFFYRKPVWKMITDIGMKSSVVYKKLSVKDVTNKLKTSECIGVYDIRLIPGQEKVRPIANMNSSWRGINLKEKFFINYELENIHLALRYECEQSPQLLGASVCESTKLFMKWKNFRSHIKMNYQENPNFYFAKVDIGRCFDTLPQDHVLDLLSSVLKQKSYLIRKYTRLKYSQNGISKKISKVATDGMECVTFIDFIRHGLKCGTIVGNGCVFIDNVYTKLAYKTDLISLLKKHVKFSIGKIGNTFLKQENGIPQGSVIAAIINDLHYGNIEQKHLNEFLASPDYLLMRWVDDYLFVATSRDTAISFIYKLHQSVAMYGASINMKKFEINFNMQFEGLSIKSIDGLFFPWCGYFIHQHNLELMYNYMQYIGEHIKDSITIEHNFNPGLSMSRKLLQAVSVKATTLVLDTIFNSNDTIILNIYQIFRFIGIKFYVHVKYGDDNWFDHQNFYADLVLCKIPLKFVSSLKNNYKKRHIAEKKHFNVLSRENTNEQEYYAQRITTNARFFSRFSNCLIKQELVQFLCYQAFLDTLRPKQTMFKNLIKSLVTQIKRLKCVSQTVDLKKLRERSKFFALFKTSYEKHQKRH